MPQLPDSFALTSRGLQTLSTLPALLDHRPLLAGWRARQAQAVLAWGRKPTAARAERLAQRHGLPLWRAEDAFVRSIGLGHACPPWGIVLDDLGIYYDAHTPSRLELLIQEPLQAEQLSRAQALLQLWRSSGVSKYNGARDALPAQWAAGAQAPVLLIDQTAGDASIAFGQADASAFARMLEAALDEHPERTLWLKVHPDVLAGKKRGHFSTLSPGQASRVQVLAHDTHLSALLARAHALYAVTSQAGFEALLWGLPVRAFGMPFWAGWGLSQDELPPPTRRSPATLEQLAHAALLRYARYIDPLTQQRCELEPLLAWLALQRRERQRYPEHIHALQFSRWKKPIARAFFGGSTVQFHRHPHTVPEGACVAVWGRRAAPAQAGSVLRLEDGFLRSVGLGADLVRPLSWVVDDMGLYYDATAPSRLEHLLQHHQFSADELAQAEVLRQSLVNSGITKYNVGSAAVWRSRQAANCNRPPVLVVGQVETDAAIALGTTEIRGNLALLRAARHAEPEAWLIYKPHPDVVAGLRKAGAQEDEAQRWCDEIVTDAPINTLLAQVQRVHVMSSLAGFEALMRGLQVVCWGQPFYAGWGLTQDKHLPPAVRQRRQRRLSLDELCAATLMHYPRYIDRMGLGFADAGSTLKTLQQWRTQGTTRMPVWRQMLRRVLGTWARLTRR
ncbi:capsular polysaccharide biosynthesis protein [Roseateles sp. BYS180W]|uniref:Capsular polysaccharide biosynthesis protein n=1 Tax=Roseateles rivi TaxID=3299028 RepID=A0ABW7FZJ2_9BURK